MKQLYADFHAKGLEILAFPCNQFGGQEPKSNLGIKAFAAEHGAEFRMMDKVMVNGAQTDPVFQFLKESFPGDIKWNFGSYWLVGKTGTVEKRSDADDPFAVLRPAIEEMLEPSADEGGAHSEP